MGEFRIAVSIFWFLMLFVHILTPECIRIHGQQSSGPMNLGADGTGVELGLEPLMVEPSSKPLILVTSGNVGSASLKEKLLKGKAGKFLGKITEESRNKTKVLTDAKTNDLGHLDHNATPGGSRTGEDLNADEKATVEIESHSVGYQTDRISSDETQVQNIDGHHVIVNPRKHVYTTLFFKSESRVLTIERTEHDEIRNCQFLTTRSVMLSHFSQ